MSFFLCVNYNKKWNWYPHVSPWLIFKENSYPELQNEINQKYKSKLKSMNYVSLKKTNCYNLFGCDYELRLDTCLIVYFKDGFASVFYNYRLEDENEIPDFSIKTGNVLFSSPYYSKSEYSRNEMMDKISQDINSIIPSIEEARALLSKKQNNFATWQETSHQN